MFEIAKRENFGLLIALSGMSGEGKTYSALKLARGIAGANGKVGVIDTENGRSKIYANDIEGGFLVAPFEPPYSSEKFIAAINEAEKAGIDVLVIDSISHEWEGIGGVVDKADNATKIDEKGQTVSDYSLNKWKAPKRVHQSLIDKLLSAKMHIVVTLRAKYKTTQARCPKTRKTIITTSDEALPIQDKGFIYDTSLHLYMTDQGRYELKKTLHQDLIKLFDGKPLNYHHGQALADFASGGVDPDVRHQEIITQAKESASQGMETLQEFWKSLSSSEKKKYKTNSDNDWKPLAEIADREKQEQEKPKEQPDDDIF